MQAHSSHRLGDPELDALGRWIEAHMGVVRDPEPDGGEIGRCARVLADAASDDGAILQALLVLAGSPLRQAGEVLRRYRDAPHPAFAFLAAQAWEEWSFWSPAPLLPVASPYPLRSA